MQAMILAAGRGSRMAPLTDHCPKPLLKVAGKSLIEWHIEKLVAAGFQRLIINTAWLGEQLKRALGDGRRFGCDICYSHEYKDGLETGGGVYQALPLLGDAPFLLLNGDVWCDWEYQQAFSMAEAVLTQHRDGCLLLVDNPSHHPDGDFYWPADTQTVHSSIQPLATNGQQRLTFSGISVLSSRLWQEQTAGRYPMAPMLRNAIAEGRMLAEYCSDYWLDVGTPERLNDLKQHLAAN